MSRAAPPLSSSYLLSDRVRRLPESLMSIGFRILVVDDEPNIRSGLAKGLAKLVDEVETETVYYAPGYQGHLSRAKGVAVLEFVRCCRERVEEVEAPRLS